MKVGKTLGRKEEKKKDVSQVERKEGKYRGRKEGRMAVDKVRT